MSLNWEVKFRTYEIWVNLFSYIYLLQGKSLGGTSISFTEEKQFLYQLQKLENFQAELKQFLPCLSIILL